MWDAGSGPGAEKGPGWKTGGVQVKSCSLSYCCVHSVSFDSRLMFLWEVSLGGGDAGVWYVIMCFLCSCSQRVKVLQDTKLKIHTCITTPKRKTFWAFWIVTWLTFQDQEIPATVFPEYKLQRVSFKLRNTVIRVISKLQDLRTKLVRVLSGLRFRDHEASL